MKKANTKLRTLFHRRVSLLLATSAFAVLSACGGGGSGSNDAPAPAPGSSASGASNLFVADAGNAAIGSVMNANLSVGTSFIDRLIQGSATRLSSDIAGMAIDKVTDRLYVAQGTEILVFDKAGFADGNIAPSRILTSSPASKFSALYLDRANDRLYVVDQLKIKVYDHASTSVNATPARSITFSNAPVSVGGLALDLTRNILYANLSDSTGCKIAVFDNAATIDGLVVENRAIDSCATGKIALDSTRNRLYTLGQGNKLVLIDQASTLNGVPVFLQYTLPHGAAIRDLAYDAVNGYLYAIDLTRLYQFDGFNGSGTATYYEASIPKARMLAAIAVR